MKVFKLKQNQDGASAVLVILLVLVIIGLGALAGIYFSRYTVLQKEYDAQLADDVEEAKAEQKKQDEVEFEQRQKEPFRTYASPTIFGDIKISFPKTWNIYALEEEQSDTQLDVTMHPDVVKSSRNSVIPYALRVKLEREFYQEVLTAYDSQVEAGTIKAQPITVSGQTGTKLTGEIRKGVDGVLVIIPLRDKTLSIWTESDKYIGEFNKILERSEVRP
jgi:cytoskeletal protein RodZ